MTNINNYANIIIRCNIIIISDNDTHARGLSGHFEQLQNIQRTSTIVENIGDREPHQS